MSRPMPMTVEQRRARSKSHAKQIAYQSEWARMFREAKALEASGHISPDQMARIWIYLAEMPMPSRWAIRWRRRHLRRKARRLKHAWARAIQELDRNLDRLRNQFEHFGAAARQAGDSAADLASAITTADGGKENP